MTCPGWVPLDSEGLLSKAIARARGALTLDFSRDAAAAVAALFPMGVALDSSQGGAAVDGALRAELVAAAERSIRRFPRRSRPGPNGSRFEHWGYLAQDARALCSGGEVVVCFFFGEVPEEALRANLGAWLVALRNGGIRPVAMGSVLRRLVARAACAVLKWCVAGATGPFPCGVGRRAGCELVHKCVTAFTDEDATRVVIAFDASNAFGSLPRQKIWEGTCMRLPELSSTVGSWLGAATTHFMWDETGQVRTVTATAGVHQGCPLSPLLFAIGLAEALQEISDQLVTLDASAELFAYLDDVVVVVPPGGE